MRLGIVCPYSLSIPGGVQHQVLGLARALRSMGVEAQVLAPCDGPPPEPWVSPLGASVPAAGNGSVAPIAPDPSAALRTIRALRDEQFDIVHLHEPLVPAPCLTALLFSDAPLVGTFHRAGEIAWYRPIRGPARWAAGRLKLRCAVSTLALATARQALGGEYELLWNGIDVDLAMAAEPWPTSGPTVLFLGRHEPRKGLAVLVEAVVRYDVDAHVWVIGEAPRRPAFGKPPWATPALNGWARWVRKRKDAGCAAPTSSPRLHCTARALAWCCWRAWPQVRRLWPATSQATPTSPGRLRTPCSCRLGTRLPWLLPCSGRWPTAQRSRPCASPASGGRRSTPWRRWPGATCSCTSPCCPPEPGRSAACARLVGRRALGGARGNWTQDIGGDNFVCPWARSVTIAFQESPAAPS